MIAIVLSTYTASVAAVPSTVARKIVRFGSSTSSAGTVADSKPSSPHRRRTEEAAIARKLDPPLTFAGVRLSTSRYASPSVAKRSSGITLRTVVTSWKTAASRTPQALRAVSSHTAPSAVHAITAGEVPRTGTSGVR